MSSFNPRANAIAVVVGGSLGIGASIAAEFLAGGSHVAVVDRDPPADPRLEVLPCDVASHEDTAATFERIVRERGRLDAVVCSVRYRTATEPKDCERPEDWAKGMDASLAPFYNVGAVACRIAAENELSLALVNVSSILSTFVTLSQPMFYHAAKSAIEAMTRYLAVLYGPSGIRVNAVVPGLISKGDAETCDPSSSASVYARTACAVPLRRSGTPQDVARAAIFLAESGFVTGQCLVVDGGLALVEQATVLQDAVAMERRRT